jgi:hypothetical protein
MAYLSSESLCGVECWSVEVAGVETVTRTKCVFAVAKYREIASG